MSDAIVIRGMTKTFGPKVAVNNLDLVVPAGALCGFIGPNGAGKTTTLRAVMSIIFPDRGQVSVLGRSSALESKDRIGYLPEERGLYRKMRVVAFLRYMARLKGVDSAGLDARVIEWLDRVGLADAARKRCQELSKGMQQKVQFLAAVMHDPELIILDEPFSGLDPVNARLVRGVIHDIHARGRTIIFSTHVMQHAEEICDHVFMINRGMKVLDDSMTRIRRRFDPHAIVVEPLDPAEDATELLRGVPGATVRGGHDGVIELEMRHGADPAAAIREVTARVAVRRVELKRVSLEDIFIDLVHADAAGQEHEERLRASLREGAGVGAGDEAGDRVTAEAAAGAEDAGAVR